MKILLIPVTDPHVGERTVRCLAEQAEREAVEVELLAIVPPPLPLPGRAYVTPQRAEDTARTIGNTWLMRITPLLREAGIPYHTRVVVGHPDAEIELAMHRADIDSVLLPQTAPRLPATHPVTLVP